MDIQFDYTMVGAMLHLTHEHKNFMTSPRSSNFLTYMTSHVLYAYIQHLHIKHTMVHQAYSMMDKLLSGFSLEGKACFEEALR